MRIAQRDTEILVSSKADLSKSGDASSMMRKVRSMNSVDLPYTKQELYP